MANITTDLSALPADAVADVAAPVDVVADVAAPAETEAPVIFTDSAAEKVKELIEEENDPNLKLRVFITGGGCSGFQYGFTFDETAKEDDFHVEKNGVTLLIDPMSAMYLENAEIDYRKDLSGEQFVIRNPNAKTTCGCGSSFGV